MNSLTRWQTPQWGTLGRWTDLRQELDRLFESPFSEIARATQMLSGWTPALDVYEDKDNVYVKVELPGMKKENIELSLHDGMVSISGERKSDARHEEAEACRSERFYGRFQRTVSLPTTVMADKVKASYKDGILTVTLPKTDEAKPKQIDVSVD
jgi:HSP20 family protein